MIDFGDQFYITYDHILRKFYLLLKSDDSIFAVVQDPTYMLPEGVRPDDADP
jgi:hypothetical protein